MTRIILTCLIALSLIVPQIALGGPNSVEQSYLKAKTNLTNLVKSKQKRYRHKWEAIIDDFEQIAKNHPQHKRAPDSIYMMAKAWVGMAHVSYIDKDLMGAVDAYHKLQKNYPADNLADDALFLAGQILENELNDHQAAYLNYNKVVAEYKSSDMYKKAVKKEKKLRQYAPKTTLRQTKGQIRHHVDSSGVRVVVETQTRSTFKYNTLSSKRGKLFYVDIETPGQTLSLPREINVEDRNLLAIKTGRQSAHKIRVVLEMAAMGDVEVFQLSDPERMVVDIRNQATPTRTPQNNPPPPMASLENILDGADDQGSRLAEKFAVTSDKPIKTIVIDAGHGGKDPGAVGKGGTLEKDITLKMALRLARKLKRDKSLNVILTRNTDKFIPLAERTAIANRANADLFVSLHVNASRDRSAKGIETYYLNFSKSDAALKIVARENGSSIDKVGDLELILFELMANAKINESSRLAGMIQESLVSSVRKGYRDAKNLGVKQGPFHVLLGATMPSVLVETSFISNKTEEKRLRREDYIDLAVRGIEKGIANFLRQSQPQVYASM